MHPAASRSSLPEPRTIPRPSNSASAPQPRARVLTACPEATKIGPDPFRWTRRMIAPAQASPGIPRSCGQLNADPGAAQRDDGVHDAGPAATQGRRSRGRSSSVQARASVCFTSGRWSVSTRRRHGTPGSALEASASATRDDTLAGPSRASVRPGSPATTASTSARTLVSYGSRSSSRDRRLGRRNSCAGARDG
jgi:hypothetical protein